MSEKGRQVRYFHTGRKKEAGDRPIRRPPLLDPYPLVSESCNVGQDPLRLRRPLEENLDVGRHRRVIDRLETIGPVATVIAEAHRVGIGDVTRKARQAQAN